MFIFFVILGMERCFEKWVWKIFSVCFICCGVVVMCFGMMVFVFMKGMLLIRRLMMWLVSVLCWIMLVWLGIVKFFVSELNIEMSW